MTLDQKTADDAEGPLWLDDLLDVPAACIEAESPMEPLRLRYVEVDGLWKLIVYSAPLELVGGAADEALVTSSLLLDLEQLRAGFETVTALDRIALGQNDPDGPYVYVEGICQSREVYLRVLAQAPEDEEPSLKIDMTRRSHPHG